jgi:hypothetical protein
MSTSPSLVQSITILRYGCSFGNTGKPHFFGIQFQNQQVQLRASDFAPPHFGNPVFPRDFVDCSVPVLSAGPLYCLLSTFWFSQDFSYIWPIALEFCSAHAGSVHGAWQTSS